MGFGMIIRDCFGDLFDERCLSCFWRGDNQTALALKARLLFRPHTVVTSVPIHIGEPLSD